MWSCVATRPGCSVPREVRRRAAHKLFMSENHRLNDNSEFADLRATHPDIPDFAWRIITGYTPKKPVSSGAWDAVRGFTVRTAAEMNPSTYDSTRRLMTMAGRFTSWVWATTGAPLNVRAVYTQNHIDRFLLAEHKNSSALHRWGLSRQLVKIGRELADADLVTLPAPDGTRRPPFSPGQIASMHGWANSLSTHFKRQNAWALLGLAGGAGLTAAEIVDVRVKDITLEDGYTFVSVRGGSPRRVPAWGNWAKVLGRAVDGRANPDEYLFRGHRPAEYEPRVIQTFLTEHPAPVRPTPSTLRTTWVLRLLEHSLPMPIVMEASGIREPQTLLRYYAHVRRHELTDYTALLAGTAVTR